jgi:hypothetical protein
MTSSVAVGSAGSRAIQWRDSSTRSPACAHRPTFVWEWPARQGTTVENVSRVQRVRQILRMGRARGKAGGESRPPQPRRACQRRKRILGLRASRAGTWGVLRAVDRRMLRQADDARRDRGAPCERGRVHPRRFPRAGAEVGPVLWTAARQAKRPPDREKGGTMTARKTATTSQRKTSAVAAIGP